MVALTQLNTALAGRYTIAREIGRGGMATVYLAQDVRHHRKVAVKVLNPELGAVLGVERFLSEIRVTANLQHPNLLPLFDSGEANGLLFYVMPFVDGESLRARLNRERQLAIDEVVRIATSIANALDYAHRQGVIHRDLKPENILLHEGQPLVADFGIALAVSNAGGARVTQTGLSLGTPQYMSPEQATGDRVIDGRTDIYSLGAVVYEMLTGDPPHTASTAQAIIAKVLTERPPDVRSGRPSVPEHVATAVECALEKLPADRFTSARELADTLQGRGAMSGRTRAAQHQRVGPSGGGARARVLASPIPWIALSVLALSVAGWTWTQRMSSVPAARSEPVFATLLPPPGARFGFGGSTFSVSPDGQRIAFIAFGETLRGGAMFVRPLNSLTATRVPGTDGAMFPFWSPDGTSIGFFAAGHLKTIHLASGTVRSLCSAAFRGGGTWSADDVILFTSEVGGPLRRVSSTGGSCTPLTIKNYAAGPQSRPHFLPDGKHFIPWARDSVFLGDIREDSVTALRDAPGTTPVFASPDFLLVRSGGDDEKGEELYAQRIDVANRRLIGQPRRILDRVTNPGGSAAVSASANGVLVAQGPGVKPNLIIASVGRDGVVDSTVLSQDVWTLRLARDGARVAFGGWGLFLHDVGRRANSRLAVEMDSAQQTYVNPVWAPRDTLLAYSHSYNRNGAALFDPRTGRARELFKSPNRGRAVTTTDWSPDGRYLAFTLAAGAGVSRSEPWVYDFTTGASRRLFDERGNVQDVRFSPDGRWIAYQSDDGGGMDVFIRPFLGPGSALPVSARGGRVPRWRADGRALFYAAPDGRILEVDVRGTSDLILSTPRAALASAPLGQTTYRSFEPSPDGQHFWFLLTTGESPLLTLIMNWWALAGETQ